MRAETVLLAILVLTSCSGSPKDPKTDGCTEDNCFAMAFSCGAMIDGMPEGCLSASNQPSEDPVSGLCAEACKETGQGEIVACYAAQLDRCEAARDSGSPPQPEHCGPRPDPDCESRCQQKFSECNGTCSTDWDTCLPCGKQCGLDEFRCVQACGG